MRHDAYDQPDEFSLEHECAVQIGVATSRSQCRRAVLPSPVICREHQRRRTSPAQSPPVAQKSRDGGVFLPALLGASKRYAISPTWVVALIARWLIPGDPRGFYQVRVNEPAQRVPRPTPRRVLASVICLYPLRRAPRIRSRPLVFTDWRARRMSRIHSIGSLMLPSLPW
jgi:hypothetical protein